MNNIRLPLLLLVALLIAACTTAPVETPQQPPPSPTAPPPTAAPPTETQPSEPTPTTPPPTEAPTAPPTAEPTPAPVENRIAPLSPGQPVLITTIRMFDETNGWAIGGLDETGDHILTTTDGGQTWQDVTPPEPAPQGDQPPKAAAAFFLDPNTAWVLYAYTDRYLSEQGPVVWRTTDRGQTWLPSQPLDTDSFFLPWIIDQPIVFADAQNGWLMENLHDAGMGSAYINLYRTTDSGATWQRIIDPMENPALQTAGKTAIAFADAQTGIATYEQNAYPSVYVDWTFDGGLTWEQQFLPAPDSAPDLFDTAFCASYAPTFFSPLSLTLAVQCEVFDENGNAQSSFFLYTTEDAGQTWATRPFPGRVPQFVTPEVVWALSRDIYRSTDGGSTWTQVKTVNWDGQFSFVSQTTGWAVARADGEIALVRTTNGGDSWELLEPQIAP